MSWILVAVLLAGDDRPTAEQVAQNVEASRARWTIANTPTRSDELRRLQRQVNMLAEDAFSARTRAEKRAAFVEARRLEREIRAVRDDEDWSGDPPAGQPQLSLLDWADLGTGDVGRLVGNCGAGLVICSRIRGEREATIIFREAIRSTVTEADHGPYLLLGVDTTRWQEGQVLDDLEIDVVCTGHETYDALISGRHTIPVLEAFDPDEEFE